MLRVCSGLVTTVAGMSGKSGFEDNIGSQALFREPAGLCLTLDRRYLLCADHPNRRVRRIDLEDGQFTVTTLCGSGENKTVDGPADECSFRAAVAVDALSKVVANSASVPTPQLCRHQSTIEMARGRELKKHFLPKEAATCRQ